MADQAERQTFPHDAALCERCGYPLKGLSAEAACPECGDAVAHSSPKHRTLAFAGPWFGVKTYWRAQRAFLLRPTRSFRSLDIASPGRKPAQFLLMTSIMSGILIGAIVYLGAGFVIEPRFHRVPIESFYKLALVSTLIILALTFIETLGVTAFSQRRAWRVPWPLAWRVCCLASVGWLPGAVIAGLGLWLLEAFGVGRPWFDELLGLVRVGWLIYAALFVLSFLWFETLVWIGVRQVRYANAWPDPTPDPAETTPDN